VRPCKNEGPRSHFSQEIGPLRAGIDFKHRVGRLNDEIAVRSRIYHNSPPPPLNRHRLLQQPVHLIGDRVSKPNQRVGGKLLCDDRPGRWNVFVVNELHQRVPVFQLFLRRKLKSFTVCSRHSRPDRLDSIPQVSFTDHYVRRGGGSIQNDLFFNRQRASRRNYCRSALISRNGIKADRVGLGIVVGLPDRGPERTLRSSSRGRSSRITRPVSNVFIPDVGGRVHGEGGLSLHGHRSESDGRHGAKNNAQKEDMRTRTSKRLSHSGSEVRFKMGRTQKSPPNPKSPPGPTGLLHSSAFCHSEERKVTERP